MTYNPDPTTSTVFSSLIIYGAIGIILYFIFEYCKENKAIYSPRMLSNKLKHPATSLGGLFKWISVTLSISDEDTLEICGFDGFIYLRFIRFLSKSTFISGILGLIVLVPIYGTADPSMQVGIQAVGMGNVDIRQPQLWASLIFAWIFFGQFLYYINEEYKEFVNIRKKFFKNPGSHVPFQTTLSCLVENLPRPLRNDISLKAFFEELFPGEVYSAVVAQNLKKCEKTIKDRAALVNKLEMTIAKYESTDDKSKLPMIGLKSDGKPVMFYGGEKISALSYCKQEIHKLNAVLQSQQREAHQYQEIAEEDIKKMSMTEKLHKSVNKLIGTSKNKASTDSEGALENEDDENLDNLPLLSTSGFVTFTTIRSQMACNQMLILTDDHPEIHVLPASAPSDYIWSNITFSKKAGEHGTIITKIVLYTGLLFWALIIAFIGAISNLENLSEYIPQINDLGTVAYSLLAGLLPVIVLSVFMSLLPMIFAGFAINLEGKKTHMDVQEEVGNWGYLYQLANVYLLLFTGSLFNLLQQAIDDPMSIFSLVGQSIPSVAVFFMNFFIAKVLLGLAMTICRIVPLLIVNIYTRLFKEKALTIRTILTGPFAHVDLDYGAAIPDLLYVITAALLYWIIAPVVTAIAAIYFAGLYLITKYQLLFIYVPKFESGGKFFYMMYGYTMVSLFVSSIAILALMALKQAPAQTILLIPLPLVVILAWRYTEQQFKILSNNMSLKSVVEIDSAKQSLYSHMTDKSDNDKDTDILSHFKNDYYKQPTLHERNAKILPYRIANKPLFDSHKQLNPAYYDAIDNLSHDMEVEPKDDTSEGIQNLAMSVEAIVSIEKDVHDVNNSEF